MGGETKFKKFHSKIPKVSQFSKLVIRTWFNQLVVSTVNHVLHIIQVICISKKTLDISNKGTSWIF